MHQVSKYDAFPLACVNCFLVGAFDDMLTFLCFFTNKGVYISALLDHAKYF